MSTDAQSKTSLTAHLKPYQFKPGQSGNPLGIHGGRRPGLLTRLKALLAEEDEDNPGTTKGERTISELYGLVKKPGPYQLEAIKEVLNRTEGKPRQTIDLTATEINVSLLAERLVEFAKKAKGVEIDPEVASQLILSSLDPDKE